MSRINWPLLDKVLDHIRAHPEQHVQRIFRCETGMCVAGWAAELSGREWAYPAGLTEAASLMLAEPGDPFVWATADDRRVVECFEVARELLGLTDEEAYWLFEAGNTLSDIERIVDELRARDAA